MPVCVGFIFRDLDIRSFSYLIARNQLAKRLNIYLEILLTFIYQLLMINTHIYRTLTKSFSFTGTVSREQMEIIVKSQPKSTKDMVKSSMMCNLKMPSTEDQLAKQTVDPLLEQDDKALFNINYSSLVENPMK